jgi:hypothetical protein
MEHQDDSWIWADGAVCERKSIVSWTDPLVLLHAPEEVKGVGSAYAMWCVLTAALSFQVKNSSIFLERLHAWWGDGLAPQYELPTSEIGWVAMFDKKDDVHFEARCEIAKEIMSSKSWADIGKAWELKVASNRMFNQVDAIQLAKTFKKSFSDPFLLKAQRAMWQFVSPYKKMGQEVELRISPMAHPQIVLDCPGVSCHVVALEKFKRGNVMRDEAIDLAMRSFIVLDAGCVGRSDSFEWLDCFPQQHTTDY